MNKETKYAAHVKLHSLRQKENTTMEDSIDFKNKS